MIEKIKFKHLQGIVDGKVDYPAIMTEVCGYNNNWLGRKWVFIWKFKEAHSLIKQIEKIEPKKVKYKEECNIKHPRSVDNISFRAMMEAQALLGNPGDRNITELMAQLIAITCFEANTHKSYKYDSDSHRFANFKNRILESSMIEMLGLYNWIIDALDRSRTFWDTKFYDVHVEDRDFELAGGSTMNNFNVILTLKGICQDFNVTIDEAWYQSYAIVQTNNLAKATQNYIQDQMRIIKEARMKAEQRKKNAQV